MAERPSHLTASTSVTVSSARRSSSPPCKTCCFGCSKRRVLEKSSRDEGLPDLRHEARSWGANEEILSDLSTFSVKEQQQRLKKAMIEEEKASREAEKVIEWVKQASQRIDASTVDPLTKVK